MSVQQACRKAGYATTTYYHWKSRQQAKRPDERDRISELEAEVRRLKLLVSELALDRRMLQEELRKIEDFTRHDAALRHVPA